MKFIQAIILAAMCLSPVWAEDSPYNIDVFFGWGGCYRPVEWTPIEVDIASTLKKPFEGVLKLSARQDELNMMNISHYFVLTPDVPLHITLVAKLAFAADAADVSIVDQSGRTQWAHKIELWDYSSSSNNAITAVSDTDMLIGVIGRFRFGLNQLPEKTESEARPQSGKVYVKNKLSRMAPWDWTGYASLDALILYDPDWSELSRAQLSAMVQWVTNGGRLLVILGTHPIAPDNPLAPVLPFKIGEAAQVTLGYDSLASLGIEAAEPQTAACWSIEPAADSNLCRTISKVDSHRLFVTSPVGFGRIGVVVFDPANMPETRSIAGEGFWVRVIGETIKDGNSEPGSRRRATNRNIVIASTKDDDADTHNYSQHNQAISPQLAGNNMVMEYLYDIAQLRPLSIWWVILLLVLLAVLIGPVDYLVLKHFDRLPLTWLTCAGWIAVFTVGAYYGVRMLRAGDLQVRVISVQDGIASPQANGGSPVVWSSVYSGLFAPASDDYAIKDISPQQWWSAMAPTQSYFYAYRQSFDLRNVYYAQHDGGNLPFSLPVNIWTMQCLLTETPQASMPFTAEVTRSGGQVKLKITNLQPTPIRSGFALVGNNSVMKFDSIPGSASKEFTGRPVNERVWEAIERGWNSDGGAISGSLSTGHDMAFVAQGTLHRTDAMLSYVRNGAAVVCVRYDGIASPVILKDPSAKYEHTHLARLVIFPK